MTTGYDAEFYWAESKAALSSASHSFQKFLNWHFTFGAVAIFEMTDSLLAALSFYPRQSDADISELKNYVKIVWSKSPATQEIHT